MKIALDKLRLGAKILVPLGVLTLLFTIVLGLGVYRLYRLNEEYGELVTHANVALYKTLRANQLAAEISAASHVLLDLDPDDPRSTTALQNLQTSPDVASALLKEARALWPKYAKTYQQISDHIDAIAAGSQEPAAVAASLPGLASGKSVSADELEQIGKATRQLAENDVKIHKLTAEIAAFSDLRIAELKHVSETLHDNVTRTILFVIGAAALSIAAGVAASRWIANRGIVTPILDLSLQMKQIASGDLGVAVAGIDRVDEVGEMARALETFKEKGRALQAAEEQMAEEHRTAEMERREVERRVLEGEREVVSRSIGGGLAKLAEMDLTYRIRDDLPDAYQQLLSDFNSASGQLERAIQHVAGGGDLIGRVTMEITSAADDLSHRTEQQAANLQETVAAISEITSTVAKTAVSARRASEVVSATKADAEKSGVTVTHAVEAINRIDKSSQDIAQIISVIDEIAFQTNLLALNAGVEAARAGDAGKGFAVVASEVRALAQRSAEAAKEIKALISTSTQEVGEGVTLVGEAGKALARIVEAVVEIDRLVSEMAVGAGEQSSALGQINTAISQIDQDVQKNAAMIEETTAATHNLKRETEALISSISSFRFTSQRTARIEAVKPPPKPRQIVRAGSTALARQIEPAFDNEDWEEF
jgi:methyl-accepting chemotaxis protein